MYLSALLFIKATKVHLDGSDEKEVQDFIDALDLTCFAIALNPLGLLHLFHHDLNVARLLSFSRRALNCHLLLDPLEIRIKVSDAFRNEPIEQLF